MCLFALCTHVPLLGGINALFSLCVLCDPRRVGGCVFQKHTLTKNAGKKLTCTLRDGTPPASDGRRVTACDARASRERVLGALNGSGGGRAGVVQCTHVEGAVGHPGGQSEETARLQVGEAGRERARAIAEMSTETAL